MTLELNSGNWQAELRPEAGGGEDLKTAYVTTATKNMDEAAFNDFPAAGHLLGFESPVAGVVPARVKLG